MNTKKMLLLSISVAVLGTSSLFAEDTAPNTQDAEKTFRKCAGCHGVKGERKALGRSKVIADMSEKDLKDAMHGYKDGSYGGPMKGLMKGQVASMSDAEIDKLAEYIATLKAK